MADILESAISAIKIIIVKAYALAVVSAFLLFAPDAYLENFKVLKLRENYEEWIGFAFLLSIAFVLSDLVSRFVKSFSNSKENRNDDFTKKRYQKSILDELTGDEKLFLKRFIDNDVSEVRADISNGVAASLIAKGVVVRPAQVTEAHSVAYLLNPWARRLLKSNPSLLFTQ